MLAVGGLKAAAKRTAFGDVSNTARTLTSAHDDSVIVLKRNHQEIVKPVVPQEKPAAFLRPAQRPLNVAASKASLNNYSVTSSEAIPTVAPLKLLSDSRQHQPDVPANKRTLLKKGTTIYKDTSGENVQPQIDNSQVVRPDSAPVVPVHQSLGPRQHKSQPQLKQEQPVVRRTQSKFIRVQEESSENLILSDPIYEDAQEEPWNTKSDEAYESYMKMLNKKEEESAREDIMPAQDVAERHRRSLPPPPLVSEPEEYWEDEEEEIYDEQGYTTAHSYRSRGDNTTGGATTVLFPKVTNKAKKEIAAAKELVESSRTQEEIEDEAWDTSMVAEYGDEIFAYMRELEVSFD